MERIRIFGDSILKRIVYSEQDNRYRTLPVEQVNELGKTLDLEIETTTIFGCTVTKGMQLLQRAMKKNLECDYVLLEFGGNDCDYLWDQVEQYPQQPHDPKTPLPVFSDMLITMISLLKEKHIEPLLVTLPPVDSRRYLDHICSSGLDKQKILSWLKDEKTIERHQELYSLQIAKIALETQTRLIDIRSAFLERKECSTLICKDGIHPNEKGHALILETFAQYRRHKSTSRKLSSFSFDAPVCAGF
ncbi:MAG: SGNH/GDSL hydrolase family protein [Sphaerochaetaceae bacterium]